MEGLSLAPSNINIQSTPSIKKNTLEDLHTKLEHLDILSETDNDPIGSALETLSSENIELEEKIKFIKKQQPLFMQFRKNELLIGSLQALLGKYPEEVELYFLLSDLYIVEKQYDVAELLLLKVFSITNNIAPFYYWKLSNLYLKKNDLDAAQYYIDKAITANPLNPSFYATVGMVAYERCKYDVALSKFEKAIHINNENNYNPNADLNFQFKRIDLLNELGKIEEVESIFTYLDEQFPSDERVTVKYKNIFQIQEKIDAAGKIKELKTKLSMIQNAPYYYTKLISLWKSLDNDWAREDLLDRVIYHLGELETEKNLDGIYIISFVVDALDLHYYQAELLLLSLEKFGKVAKNNILVQCLDRVDKVFLDFLTDNGYKYRTIEPYLDGKYCNKLQQLEAFKDIEADGIILLDADMFVLQPFDIPNSKLVYGKTVDGPNPPLSVLKNTFHEANIDLPNIVNSDWDMKNNLTIECNFNGGFYYVPKGCIAKLSTEWRKWATWLYERSNLFETKQQSIHTDQVSMAMALTSINIPYGVLSANVNCPIHNNRTLTSFQFEKEVVLLHYHREISSFGLLNTKYAANEKILQAIGKANDAIADKGSYDFFLPYKLSLIKQIDISESLTDLEIKLSEMTKDIPQKLNLILHAGTPKTATTSLQFFFDDHYDELLENGILYPKVYIDTPAPKHQWLVGGLISNNFQMLLQKIESSLESVEANTHTVIFSTEGIYNHWQDYNENAKAFLVLLSKYFNVKLWVWFREPVSFIDSLYRQYLKNPRVKGIECYGKDLSLNEMMEDDWFIGHLDYLGFLLDTQKMLGSENIEVFQLQGDIISQICIKLDLQIDTAQVKRKNLSLNNASISLLRIINQYTLSHEDKDTVVDYLYEVDKILDKYDNRKMCNSDMVPAIKKFFSLQTSILAEHYQIQW